MRIAYANATYSKNGTGGGNVHVGQFIENSVTLGHKIWAWSCTKHPKVKKVPESVIDFVLTMRKMDVLYVRVERTPPSVSRWALFPHRTIYGFPVVVWEFNSIPEYGLLRGQSEDDVQRAIKVFKRYGRGCDLAVCVSSELASYVHDTLGIERVLVVPNGSDPDLFRSDVSPVSQIRRDPDQLNVIWIGSADIAWHNFEILREAARLLWNRDDTPRISFHIIGQGRPGLMRNMPPNVKYWGPERYDMLPHWLAAMDVGLVLYNPGPADYGSPLKLFDYLASGLAVVGTFQPQVRQVFKQLKQTDLLIPHNGSDELVNKLLYLARNRERVRSQGEAGRLLVIENYTWRRAVSNTLSEIEMILNDKR